MSKPRCANTVTISYPCALSEGHEGICQADPEGQLRIYGITVENLREIQRDLADARRLGLIRSDGGPTAFGRYVKLRAGLERVIPYAGPAGLVRSDALWAIINES